MALVIIIILAVIAFVVAVRVLGGSTPRDTAHIAISRPVCGRCGVLLEGSQVPRGSCAKCSVRKFA